MTTNRYRYLDSIDNTDNQYSDSNSQAVLSKPAAAAATAANGNRNQKYQNAITVLDLYQHSTTKIVTVGLCHQISTWSHTDRSCRCSAPT